MYSECSISPASNRGILFGILVCACFIAVVKVTDLYLSHCRPTAHVVVAWKYIALNVVLSDECIFNLQREPCGAYLQSLLVASAITDSNDLQFGLMREPQS